MFQSEPAPPRSGSVSDVFDARPVIGAGLRAPPRSRLSAVCSLTATCDGRSKRSCVISTCPLPGSFGVSSHTVNDAILAEGQPFLVDDPARFGGVTTIGVDVHVRRHARPDDKYVTVITDLTPVRTKTGPARPIDMIIDRSKHAFKTLLAALPEHRQDEVDIVGMERLTGYETAASEEPAKTTLSAVVGICCVLGCDC